MLDFLKRESRKVIHVNEIDSLIGSIDLIDIREPYEYRSTSLKTSKNIPMGELLGNPDKYLSRDKTYHIICQSGGRSSRTCGCLSRLGYDVVDVAGGMGSYIGNKRK